MTWATNSIWDKYAAFKSKYNLWYAGVAISYTVQTSEYPSQSQTFFYLTEGKYELGSVEDV